MLRIERLRRVLRVMDMFMESSVVESVVLG
jgi:hypothetical protein